MTKTQSVSNKKYLITPSLLNSWAYIRTCVDGVVEANSDTMCLEDKKTMRQEEAFKSFLKTLYREPIETNVYMKQGIEFEESCYRGETCISPIIENGAYQISGTKDVEVEGIDFVMYGRLDVLKGGVIYDIKRDMKYSPQKYLKSYQHGFYLELFDTANKFEYLIYDGNNLHIETYYRDQCESMESVIGLFVRWLKKNNLLDIYLTNWESKY